MGGRYLIKYLFGGLLCYGNWDPLIKEQIACIMFQVGLELNHHVANIKQDK